MSNSMLDFIFDIYETVSDARRAQRTYTRLSSMSDSELARQGLDRSDLVSVAFRQQKR